MVTTSGLPWMNVLMDPAMRAAASAKAAAKFGQPEFPDVACRLAIVLKSGVCNASVSVHRKLQFRLVFTLCELVWNLRASAVDMRDVFNDGEKVRACIAECTDALPSYRVSLAISAFNQDCGDVAAPRKDSRHYRM